MSNPRHAKIDMEAPQSVVYFDGSCPLCRAEIGYYRRSDVAQALCFIDVSKPNVELDNGLNAQQAMQRFHVRTREGQLLSGAAAFVEVWSRLPNIPPRSPPDFATLCKDTLSASVSPSSFSPVS
jgi:predicted DCC family thiol-disulfide oxidoreductase YuxK